MPNPVLRRVPRDRVKRSSVMLLSAGVPLLRALSAEHKAPVRQQLAGDEAARRHHAPRHRGASAHRGPLTKSLFDVADETVSIRRDKR